MGKKKFLTFCAIRRHLSNSSLAHTEIRYDYLMRWLGKRRLSPELAEEFVLHLRQKNLRNTSINGYIRVLWLIDLYYRENDNDLRLLRKIDYFPKQKRVPTILTPQEVEAILNVHIDYQGRSGITKVQADKLDELYSLAIWMLASTGCRFDEMASLKKENIQVGITEGYVLFKDTKTKIDRRVPLPPQYVMRLKPYLALKAPSDLAFPSTSGIKLSGPTFNPNLRHRVKAAGIVNKHVHAHCFRNTFIMEHVRKKSDLLAVMLLVGHKDPKTTMEYTTYNDSLLLETAQNHFLFQEAIPEETLLSKAVETVRSIFDGDGRFIQNVKKENGAVTIQISTRKGSS